MLLKSFKGLHPDFPFRKSETSASVTSRKKNCRRPRGPSRWRRNLPTVTKKEANIPVLSEASVGFTGAKNSAKWGASTVAVPAGV
jgi:hypothetical protein